MDYKELYNIKKTKMKCSVCGNVSVQMLPYQDGNDSSDCDLDLRKRGTYRDIIHFNVRECPVCGYASTNLNEPFCDSREFLQGDEYINTSGISFKDKMSELHYKCYLIETAFYENNKIEELELPLNHLMQCIWCCDDSSDFENATNVRRIAVELIDRITNKGFESVSNQLIKADMLRRTGNFIIAKETIDRITTTFQRWLNIKELSQYWINKKDSNVHYLFEKSIVSKNVEERCKNK